MLVLDTDRHGAVLRAGEKVRLAVPSEAAIFTGMNIGTLIMKTPGVCGGRACVSGHRIPVFRVALAFRAGHSPEEMLTLWPSLNLAEMHAAIAYALANAGEIDLAIAAEDRAWAATERVAHAAP